MLYHLVSTTHRNLCNTGYKQNNLLFPFHLNMYKVGRSGLPIFSDYLTLVNSLVTQIINQYKIILININSSNKYLVVTISYTNCI